MRSLGFSLEEALVSLRRSGQSAAMSIGTITIAFLTLGGFFLISANLQAVVARWSSAAEMSVYLQDDVDEATREALVAELTGHPAVAGVEHVSKTQAVERFKADFPELGDVAGNETTAFPSSLEVRLRTDPASTGAAEAMAGRLIERPGVADVRYDVRWLDRLLTIVTAIRYAGLAMAIVLILGAAFTVAAVVRLSLQTRHDEIDIMGLVGAPLTFIRGPFVAEGALLGGTGAGIALLVLWALFVSIRPRLNEAVAGLASIGEVRFLGVLDGLLLVVAGCVVGALAGVVASRVAR